MNKLFSIITATGLTIIIGAAGSTDLGTITLTQTLIYTTLGLIITFIGFIGYKKTERKAKTK